MPYQTILSVNELSEHLNDPEWAIIDARFALADPGLGRRNYESAHIPGAVYVHLDEHLSGPVVKGVTGRHPLPSIEKAGQVFSRLGIAPGMQVVAYDDLGGALAAARAWWMLRWLGHQDAAVLDGGWQAWQRSGFPQRSGSESRHQRVFTAEPNPSLLMTSQDIERMRKDPACLVLDARAAERYRGENEIIDPVAGHIPGSVSVPYTGNLNPDLTFLSPQALRQRYMDILGEIPAENAACYCGSGATAIHNILAMLVAGLGEARLYGGSWSEWITDPSHLVAVGEERG